MQYIYRYTVSCLCFSILIGLIAGCSSSLSTKKGVPEVRKHVLSEEAQNKFDYYFLEAERLKAKEDYAAAFEMFRHCEALDPYSAEVKAALAPFYFSLGNDSLGIIYQKEALRLSPDNYWYGVELAEIYQGRKDFVQAIAVYEALAKRFPEKDDPTFALLELYPQNGDYGKAVVLLNELEKKLGKSEELSMRKFQLYLYQNKNKEAFQEMESLVKEYPDDSRYRCILGDMYLSYKKYPEAYETYQEILAEDPSNEAAMLSMAEYYEALLDTTAYYNQVDSILFSSNVSEESKGRLMRQMIMKSDESSLIDSTQILVLFDRVNAIDSTNFDMLMLNAQYLLAMNMTERATPVLERLLKVDPSNDLVRKQLLSNAIRKDNYSQVVDLCLPFVESAPESPEDLMYFYYLAASYHQLKEYDPALATLKKALGYITDEVKPVVVSDFYSMMGEVYHQQKKTKEAYAAYDSALVYNPLNIGVLNNYAYYISEDPHGDWAKAEQMSLKTIETEPENETYLDTYAWILYKLKRYEDAKMYIDRALQNGGAENAVELDHAGDIYFELKLKREAIEFWNKALEKEIEEPEKVRQKIKRAE